MKIGVISDTHGCVYTWKNVYNKFFKDADLIIHAGDVLYHGPRNTIPKEYNPQLLAEYINDCPTPIIAACGNCDAEVDSMLLNIPIQSPYAFIQLDKLRIVVNHGHRLSDNEKLELAEKYQAKLFITGHTHIASLIKTPNTILLNPGSPGMSKSQDKKGTISLVLDNKVSIFDVETEEEIHSAIF